MRFDGTAKERRTLPATGLRLIGFLFAAGCLVLLAACSRALDTAPQVAAHADPVQVYDGLLAAVSSGEDLLYHDNLTGRIVWNQAQFMESLINMFELTGDTRYIEIFARHADHVMRTRDDHAGRPDSFGELRKGWQTGGYYTLGLPLVLPDEDGQPALEVQGVRRAGNNHTTVEVPTEGNARFTVVIRNDFRRSEPVVERFDNLSLDTVEGVVNAQLCPESWIRVRVLGTSPPAPGIYHLSQTYTVVLHELHTPIIAVPFLRFADLVFRTSGLDEYRETAIAYVKAMEESLADYAASWREDEEGAFLIFEPSGAFWCSGFPVPYNGLSANGRLLLWLWRTSGKQEYLNMAVAVARKVRAGLTFLADGTLTMPYWIVGSPQY
ncbi:MAG TPA: hypothetical protein ENN53_06820, partial [Candidatus Acetothermia bacterium]|nr:hypothetical protein [Candidatus Acetothermia bacterium]